LPSITTTNVATGFFERPALPLRPRLQLEDLVPAGRANGVCQLAHLQLAQQLLKLGGQFVEVNRPDQAAVRLGRCRGLFSCQAGEGLALQQALADFLSLCLCRVVLRHIDATIGRRNFDQDFAKHYFRRCCEVGAVRLEVGPRLVIGRAEFLRDLLALHLADHHVALDVPPEVSESHPLCFQRRLELRLIGEVVLLPDVVDD